MDTPNFGDQNVTISNEFMAHDVPVELSFPTLALIAKLDPQQPSITCQSILKILILNEWQDLAYDPVLYLTMTICLFL